jgi:AP-1 complex subunit beta-1
MNDLMNGFEGLNFGGQSSGEPLPAAMQLQNAQGSSQGAPQAPKKDSDDLLGLL